MTTIALHVTTYTHDAEHREIDRRESALSIPWEGESPRGDDYLEHEGRHFHVNSRKWRGPGDLELRVTERLQAVEERAA